MGQTHGSGKGGYDWTLSQIGGGGATLAGVASATADEFGVSRLSTPSTSGRGGTLSLQVLSAGLTQWSDGQKWTAKVRLGATVTSMDAWSGFASSLTASVRTADATAFIGVRYDAAAGGNWYGVLKSGAAAEDTVDLGVAGGTDWARVGWRGTPAGVQFFLWSWVPGLGYREVDVGGPLNRTLGANVGPIAVGVVTRAAAARLADVDLWSFAGAWAR